MRRGDLRIAAASLLLGLLLAPATAEAACTVSSTGVAFGSYDSLSGAPDDSTGTVNVDCHPSDQSIEIEIGAGLSGSFAARRMSNGAATLDYNLYTDSGRSIVWGDGTGGSVTQTLNNGVVNSGTRRFSATVYGRIPGSQSVPMGTYGDTLIVTVIF